MPAVDLDDLHDLTAPQCHADPRQRQRAGGPVQGEELVRANPVPSAAMSAVTAGPDQFFNPYQFVPVTAPDTQGAITTADLAVGNLRHATHDRYVPGTHSGRILCTLTAETPMFVGAKRDAEVKPAKLEHYHLPGSDQPAIPATSLRGLISSIAETASQSALRVLQNPEVYSYRNPAAATGDLDKIPTAVGMVVRRLGPGSKPQLYIRPLCLPTFRATEAARALALYKPYFPEPVLRTYVGVRGDRDPRKDIADPAFEDAIPNWKAGMEAQFRLASLTWNRTSGSVEGGGVRAKGPAVLEQARSTSPQDPRVPGVLRALGCSPNRQIAGTKTHELFIRFPDAATFQPDTTEPVDLRQMIVLPDDVLNRFHRLADEMTDQWREDDEDLRPYEPRGTRPSRRSTDPEKCKLRIAPGDLVYFRLEDRRGATLVAEVSFSSIWRKEISKDASSPARCHDFFAQISPDLLPLGPQRLKEGRVAPLTPAELLFGFVEDQSMPEGVAKPDRPAYALAGRLRFSAGVASGTTSRLPEVALRILSTPKPPSPSMYFQRAKPDANNGGDYIAKSALKLSKEFQVRGRKFYLHHAPAFTGSKPWESREEANAAQKVSIRPVATGAAFQFHLDYDNLSNEELNLLLYSLRPSPAFRHKLGLGKPLGLGSVRIDVDAVDAIERAGRYSEESLLGTSPRWTAQSMVPSAGAHPALERIGTTQVQGVSYPLVNVLRGPGQPRPQEADRDFGESQHYPWFVATDVGSGSGQNKLAPAHQAMTPLRGDSPALQPLNRLDYRPPRA